MLAALREAGVRAEMIAWDDPTAGLAGFDLCVLRSTWNYYTAPNAFLSWVEKAARTTKLLNPVDAIRWNIHKGYLRNLDARGVPVVPTVWLSRGSDAQFHNILEGNGWSQAVIKPTVSAASFQTRRYALDEADTAQEFLTSLLLDRDVMVQRYMPSVENRGERAIVWIGGELTHVVTKRPRFTSDMEHVSAAEAPTSEDRNIADRAISLVAGELLYARVDVMRDPAGALRLSELELIEPSLFMQQHRPALERLVSTIVKRL
ncbi:MAG: hypothetical protein V1790_16830 [Planctomycetota bacterium]